MAMVAQIHPQAGKVNGTVLRLRGTFIDTDETDCEPHHGSCQPRARSSPPSSGVARDDGHAFFADEREYVESLSDKLGALWRAVDASPENTPTMAIVATAFGFSAERRSAEAWMESEGPAARDTVGQDEATKDIVISMPEAFDVQHTGAASKGQGEWSEAVSVGSIAHPELCSRPCLYFASGQCTNGIECSFCHLPHPRREAHLGKKFREVSREIPAGRASELVLPLLWEKMVELQVAEGTRRAFDDLADACGASGRRLPARMSRGERAIIGALRPLRLRSLLSAAQRCVLNRRPIADAAAEKLLATLRGGARSSSVGAC